MLHHYFPLPLNSFPLRHHYPPLLAIAKNVFKGIPSLFPTSHQTWNTTPYFVSLNTFPVKTSCHHSLSSPRRPQLLISAPPVTLCKPPTLAMSKGRNGIRPLEPSPPLLLAITTFPFLQAICLSPNSKARSINFERVRNSLALSLAWISSFNLFKKILKNTSLSKSFLNPDTSLNSL